MSRSVFGLISYVKARSQCVVGVFPKVDGRCASCFVCFATLYIRCDLSHRNRIVADPSAERETIRVLSDCEFEGATGVRLPLLNLVTMM